MRALTVKPGVKDSLSLQDLPEPPVDQGPVLVEGLAVGLCGTDAEIVSGGYGQAPPGADRLVLGHENLGRVLEAPAGSHLSAGDLVVGIVRRPLSYTEPVAWFKVGAGKTEPKKTDRKSVV